jgi:hypothetical protein
VTAILEYRAGDAQLVAHDLATPYHSWTGHSDSHPSGSLYRIDLVAMFARIARRSFSHTGEAVITIVVLGVAALLLHRMRSSEATPGHQTLSDAIICLATLLCVHHLDYDLLLLAFPLAALVYRRVPGLLEDAAVRRGTLWLFALMAANYMSTRSVLERIAPHRPVWLVLVSANSLALVLIFVIYGLTVLRWSSVDVVPAREETSRVEDPGHRASEPVSAHDGA